MCFMSCRALWSEFLAWQQCVMWEEVKSGNLFLHVFCVIFALIGLLNAFVYLWTRGQRSVFIPKLLKCFYLLFGELSVYLQVTRCVLLRYATVTYRLKIHVHNRWTVMWQEATQSSNLISKLKFRDFSTTLKKPLYILELHVVDFEHQTLSHLVFLRMFSPFEKQQHAEKHPLGTLMWYQIVQLSAPEQL